VRKRLDIIFEDDDLLIVNKPPGLLTSTVPREKRPTLLAHVREYLGPRVRLGLIHRLDRDARGLLVFSKNDLAYKSLKTQFYHHTVDRTYLAVCVGVPTPPVGDIGLPLIERADGTVRVSHRGERGERALTHYEIIRTDGKRTLVRLILHTGRKHQIRAHLAHLGTPVIGDQMYAKPPHNKPPLLLAAVRLGFTHPRNGKPVLFELPIPSEFDDKVTR